MRIAIEGCCHGELDQIFKTLVQRESQDYPNIINLLIICGDFQAMRNKEDLESMACPDKYKELGTFHNYYGGTKRPPCPVLFIGGNHEASNYMWELYHGGWACENIYFLGWAGMVKFGGLRIAGISGIYKEHHYSNGHYERMPLDNSDCRSIYHVRKIQVYKLAQIKSPIDVFLSHDWPRGIAHYGDTAWLLSVKKFLRKEIQENTLGSMPNEFLLKRLKPKYWFSAHMHVKFEATYVHPESYASRTPVAKQEASNPDEIAIEDSDDDAPNPDEIVISDDDDTKPAAPAVPEVTRFMALDKCLPRREFFHVLDIPSPLDGGQEPYQFEYDPEWLAILRATDDLISFQRNPAALPSEDDIQRSIHQHKDWIAKNVVDLKIPLNFQQTAPTHCEGVVPERRTYVNPQTVALCDMIGTKMKKK